MADVQATLGFSSEQGVTVSVRGAAHSQSGQGLGPGIVLDMTSLRRIVRLDLERGEVEVEAGATWRAVVDATFAQGWIPSTLTHALDTTVGGTLSVGGIGAAAWSDGPQVDNVLYLDVVTAAGKVVRCSLDHERELFDAARAGLGQCGVIVRAGLPLRRCGRHVDTRTFVYRDVADLLRDAERLAESPSGARWIAVRLGPDLLSPGSILAVMSIGEAREGSANDPSLAWPAHYGFEAPTQRHPTWTSEGTPGHPFFRVYGAPQHLVTPPKHPWVDVLLSLTDAPGALAELAKNSLGLLQLGPAQVIFVQRRENPAPLLVTPPGRLSVGLGVFPVFPADSAERAASVMQRYAANMLALGGRRYLSGYFGRMGTADWAEHYGTAWPAFRVAKARLDPHGRFESPLVDWR